MSASENNQGPLAPSQQLVLAMILSVMGCIALGLILIWVNTERTKLAYNLRSLQAEIRVLTDKHDKLSIERKNLLSPQALGAAAERLGLLNAKPGQVRRMDLPATNSSIVVPPDS